MPHLRVSKILPIVRWRSALWLALAMVPLPGAVAPAAGPATVGAGRLVTAPSATQAAPLAQAVPPLPPTHANFGGEAPSADARRVADWAVASGDSAGLPFVIIDKRRARLFVFEGSGRLRGASTALLGLAHGDDSVPGIGSRKLATIRPEERTTPAGRFVAALGRDFHQDILWIDYDAALSLHRVVTGNPGDHRLARLKSTALADKRISYGCINVPVAFYNGVVLAAFTGTHGIVYILPEQRTLEEVFRPLQTWAPPPAPAPGAR